MGESMGNLSKTPEFKPELMKKGGDKKKGGGLFAPLLAKLGIGGALDPRFTPLEMDWTVKSLHDGNPITMETWKYIVELGPTAVLTSGNLTLVVMTNSIMMVDRSVFFANDLDPKDFHSTIVKSPHCEPAFFDDWVEANFNVDAPGATSANLKTLGHTNCARPMFPLEEDTVFVPQTEVFSRA